MTLVAAAVTALLLSACATGIASHTRAPSRTEVENPALAALPDIPVLHDIAYTVDAGQPQRLDVCLPPDDVTAATGRYPAIVEVHGGGWTHGDKADPGYRGICQWLASAGYVTFDLDYRLAPRYPFPAGLDDVQAAVRWVRQPAQVARFDLDPDRIGAFGGSAGGNLVSLLGTAGSGGWTTGSRVAAVVEMSGPVDLTGPDTTRAFLPDQLEYLHCTRERECPQASRASPIDQVDPTDPPFFITHSTDESEIPISQSTAFVAKLREAGVDTTFVAVRGHAHSIAMMNDDLKKRISAFYERTLGSSPAGARA